MLLISLMLILLVWPPPIFTWLCVFCSLRLVLKVMLSVVAERLLKQCLAGRLVIVESPVMKHGRLTHIDIAVPMAVTEHQSIRYLALTHVLFL